jgi:hypothetical protein
LLLDTSGAPDRLAAVRPAAQGGMIDAPAAPFT